MEYNLLFITIVKGIKLIPYSAVTRLQPHWLHRNRGITGNKPSASRYMVCKPSGDPDCRRVEELKTYTEPMRCTVFGVWDQAVMLIVEE